VGKVRTKLPSRRDRDIDTVSALLARDDLQMKARLTLEGVLRYLGGGKKRTLGNPRSMMRAKVNDIEKNPTTWGLPHRVWKPRETPILEKHLAKPFTPPAWLSDPSLLPKKPPSKLVLHDPHL